MFEYELMFLPQLEYGVTYKVSILTNQWAQGHAFGLLVVVWTEVDSSGAELLET
jgi:hypothetical protein